MMGPRQEAQAALFYAFSLEDHVPQDHLLRSIDRFVDLDSIRAHLADFYSHTGRPSVDPELPIRMLLVGYCFGIRSERRLCAEVHLNLAYRWFCRLDLTDRVTKASHRTSLSSTNPAAPMGHGPGPTLNGTPRTTSISARKDMRSNSSAATIRTRTAAQPAREPPNTAR